MIQRSILLLTIVLALAACGSSREETQAERAKTALIGISEDSLFACAGQPVEEQRDGADRILIYRAELSQSVRVQTPAAPLPMPMPEPEPHFTYTKTCATAFLLRDGRVRAIRMEGRTDTGRPSIEACGKTVERCMKGR